MTVGALLKPASELRVDTWIGANGQPLAKPLRLADLGEGHKVIFAFQHWCPGCHSHGFPTLKVLLNALKDKGVGFAALQTVFEGFEENTVDKLRVNQMHHGLSIPFGHDAGSTGPSHFMVDYQTGGTPWFTVIDPDGLVIYSDFHLSAAKFLTAFGLPLPPVKA